MRLEQFARRQAEVLETIRELDRPVSVFEIAQHRGEPPTTVGNLVNALARRGAIVVVYVAPPRRGGRPGRFWAPNGWEPRPPKGDWRDDFRPGGRSVLTRFKPGELSGRAAQLVQPIGTLRIVAGDTLQRKVSDTPGPNHRRWRSVHELVWIETHGPVPRGHVVVFRPGQHTTVEAEITLDRLELVSRAELMRRNSVHRHGPEIASLSQLRGALNRQINRRQRAAEKERA